jgi:subtilisin family serine protease
VARFSSRHRYITIAAPGVHIPSLNSASELYIGDGTSQAAALTSGALALIWSAHPTETNRQIAARLIAGARDAGPPGPDNGYGRGVINPSRSAHGAITATSPNPVFTAAQPYLTALTFAAALAQPGPPQYGLQPPVTTRPASSPPSPQHSAPTVTIICLTLAALALLATLLITATPKLNRRSGALHNGSVR